MKAYYCDRCDAEIETTPANIAMSMPCDMYMTKHPTGDRNLQLQEVAKQALTADLCYTCYNQLLDVIGDDF